MGDGKIQMVQDQWFRCGRDVKNKDHSSWMMSEDKCEKNSPSSSSSIGESTISNASSSSSSSVETMDDASSPASSTSSSSNGSLFDLSTLMAQLPIKRGLSECYEGRSESFTCLARVTSVEDLPKKETPYSRKMKKSCKSSYTLPKPIISKKAKRTSFLSPFYSGKSNSSISRSRHPLIPVHRT